MSGNLGAQALFVCVSQLDESLKQGRQPEAAQIEQLRLLLEKVLEEIDGLSKPDVVELGDALGEDELQAKLTALSVLLESDLGAAEQALAELRAGGGKWAVEVEAIAARVDEYAIVEALELIEILRKKLIEAYHGDDNARNIQE